MRLLESAPRRYDRGIRILTFGGVDRTYDRLIRSIEPGQRVLDIGCGTGALTVRAARRGACVRGLDRNPEMLAIARRRMTDEGLEDRVELVEKGVAELDTEPGAYDVVMSGLCFSELSTDEVAYTIAQLRRLLKPGGLFLLADEVMPRRWLGRVAYRAVRVPVVIITYLFTQQTTHALEGIDEKLREAGFVMVGAQHSAMGGLGSFIARNPAKGAKANLAEP